MSMVWIDGRLIDKYESRISVFDHGLLFGDGVLEGMRAFNGRVLLLEEHLARLNQTAQSFGIAIPYRADLIAEAIHKTLTANARSDGYILIVVTRGTGPLSLDPRKCDPTVMIFADDVALADGTRDRGSGSDRHTGPARPDAPARSVTERGAQAPAPPQG